MPFEPNTSPKSLALGALLLSLLPSPALTREDPPVQRAARLPPTDAQFRGCDAAGWCRFSVVTQTPTSEALYRVRPDGVVRVTRDVARAIAARDRLNALLASMIHQHKHIQLHDLRELDDGTFAATVTVNGTNVASDPMLVDLRDAPAGTTR